MADVTSEVTVDTGEWIYVDSFGGEHTVTNGQTFNLSISDDGAADVQWSIPEAQSMTTTDGYTINFRPEVDGNNIARQITTLTDAGEGSAFVGRITLAGELVMECPVSGRIQRWEVASLTPSNADMNAAGTITAAILEDQFGNSMTLPSTGSGITVGQGA